MANLGSNDTAVVGDDFSLPAGAQLDEDNGDLVIRDSGGNIVFRRDEANGEWVVDSLKAEEIYNDIGEKKVQTAFDGLIVPVASGLGAADAIDPSNTTTPLQDALDKADAARVNQEIPCGVITPPSFEEGATVTPYTRQHIQPAAGGTEIVFTATGSDDDHGIDTSGVGGEFSWSGRLELTGPGKTETTGDALLSTGSRPRSITGNYLRISGWGGRAMYRPGFQIGIEVVDINDCQPQEGEYIAEDIPSTGGSIGSLNIYGADDNNNRRRAVQLNGLNFHVGSIHIDQAGISEGVKFYWNSAGHVGTIDMEEGTGSWAIQLEGSGLHNVGEVSISGDATVDYIIDCRVGEGFVLSRNSVGLVGAKAGTVNNAFVNIQDDTGGPVILGCLSGDVVNNSGGTLSTPVACLADLTTVS